MYITLVTALYVIFIVYVTRFLCNFKGFLSKQTYYLIFYLASSYSLVYGIRMFFWGTLSGKEVDE